MDNEELLQRQMLNLAAAWEAEAAAAEARGSTAQDQLRACAAQLRDRVSLHRRGPAWSVNEPF